MKRATTHPIFHVNALLLAICLWTGIALIPQPAQAVANCTFTSVTLALGNFDVYGATVTATGAINGGCTRNTTGGVTFSAGNGLHYSSAHRHMACTSGACLTNGDSADLLQYELYTTAALSTVFNTVGTIKLSKSLSNVNPWSPAVNFWGNIPVAVAGGVNDVSVGTYTDTVVITANF